MAGVSQGRQEGGSCFGQTAQWEGGFPEPIHETLRDKKHSQPAEIPVSSHNDPCHTRDRGLPALVERTTLGEARGGLDANDRTLMELFNGASTGIGA